MEPKINQVESVGLCTNVALQRLGTSIEDELRSHEAKLCGPQTPKPALLSWPLFPDNILHWTSAVLMILATVLKIVAAAISGGGSLILESVVMVCLVGVCIGVARWDSRLREMEVINHAKDVLHKLRDLISREIHWPTDVYSPLFRPATQSITEQWTYRDGHLVNLPTPLLVRDDVILLRPGEVVPTTVCSFDDNNIELQKGEKFQPVGHEPCNQTTAHQPLKPGKFVILDTPYLPYLRACILKNSRKPSPILEVKRTVCVGITERWVLPLAVILSLLANSLRFALVTDDVGDWVDMLINLQVNTTLPLLSFMVPILWITVTSYGNARIVTLFHKAKHEQTELTEYPDDEISEQVEVKDEELSWLELLEHFKSACFGPSSHLPRSASMLYGLGTITSLCCVDKRGILSYPNPTIEKVFFMSSLRDDKTESDCSSDSEVFSQDKLLDDGNCVKRGVSIASHEKLLGNEDYFPEYHAEVLTLSLDSTQNPTSLQFDETSWERHINSLKPMGLNILLNTCNPDTVERYDHFFNHVHSILSSDDTTQPVWVAHRRCLCQLAYQIGFTEQATQMYELQQQLALYRPVPHDIDESHSRHIHKTRSFIKKRTPVPHVMSTLVQDSRGETNQLLTEGTAELVLSLCSDFWDGCDLCPLDDNDRKKILDFYQRAALSSYCSAFAYQPMVDSVAQYFDDLYIELPAASKMGKPPPDVDNMAIPRSSWDVDMSSAHQQARETTKGRGRKYHSLDSAMDKMGDIKDPGDCYRAQCGQIFIGMVASNYQAKSDIVALIENLDHACIRFVHFSRDQELRSRVFSEKMGLEAGWNCHISLQSDPSSTSSNSGVSRQHSDQSSSIKSNPSRKSLDVTSNITVDSPKEIQTDVTNVKVLWHREEQKEKTMLACDSSSEAHMQENCRERSGSRGKDAKVNVTIEDTTSKSVKIAEVFHEDDQITETSQLLPKTTFSPKKSVNLTGLDLQKEKTVLEGGANVCTGKDIAEVDEMSQLHFYKSPAVISKSSGNVTERKSHTSPESCFSDSALPNVHISEEGSGSSSAGAPFHPKSNLEVLSEEMSVSWRSRNISETRTMSDDTETLSHVTDSETAAGFDISNRAKLPRGIDKIRPHLEKVDNVPLLVPLFTDATPETTQEMLRIMQDYGEVVCCLGSSVNLHNMPLFAQADISIGVEPLYPQVCLHRPLPKSHSCNDPHWHTPTGLASVLIGLPCSLSFWCDHNFSLMTLIQEARGLCSAVSTIFTFLMFCLLSLSVIQLLASVVLLPPPLSGRHVLWLAVVIVPMLSLSLFHSQINHQSMTSATGKNLKHRDAQVIQLYIFYFFSRFVVSVFILLLCHAMALHAFCIKTLSHNETCHLLFGNGNSSSSTWNGLDGENYQHLLLAQNIQTALIVLYFIVTSVSYVHNLKPLWRKHPFTSRTWCATVLILLLLQIIYFVLDVRIWTPNITAGQEVTLADVPSTVWIVAFLWPLIIIVLNEAVKLIEIRVFVRWQRRTQLQFGTKLGMNSPF